MPSSMLKRELSELFAREFYRHRGVSRGLARTFFVEFEQREKAAAGGNVEFMFVEIVHFFAVAAAYGVVGNLAYDALRSVVRATRRPRKEQIGGGVKFEVVVSRTTYNRLRRRKYPNVRARRTSPSVEKKLEKEYRLMVTLKSTKR